MGGFRDWWTRRTSSPSQSKTDGGKEVIRELRPLSEEERSALEAGLDLAARLAAAPRPLEMHHVQTMYDAFLAEEIQNPDALIALGLAFGEQLTRKADLEWVRVSDEYGAETCVAPRGKKINCAPISMIQKRLLRKESVTLAQLRDDTVNFILKTVDDGVDNR